MKTIAAFWKFGVLVLALLILGITPTVAQDTAARDTELYIPYIGGNPSVDEAAAKNTVKDDKLDRKVERFVYLLESDGFVVQEGKLLIAPLPDECCKPEPLLPCTFFNQASPYQAAFLPRSPGQTTAEPSFLRYSDYLDLAATWRLRPDEAVVFVGLTPPPVGYFGFQTYLFFTVDEAGKRVRRWNNFGDQTNQLVINTAGTPNGTPGNPFNSLTVRITTADRGIDARVREVARGAGYPPSIMNTEPIPQLLLRMGIDEDGDWFSSCSAVVRPSIHFR